MKFLSKMTEISPRSLAFLFASILLVYGVWITAHSVALPVTSWMSAFKLSDYPDFASLVNFILNLRNPIPPVLAILEIINYQFNGTTAITGVYLYRIGLIGSYLLVLALAYPSKKHMLITFLVSLIFLSGTVITHPGNPQSYDILYPFFFLLSVSFLKLTKKMAGFNSWQVLFSILAGFFLSMTELSRPFFIILLPIVVIWAWMFLRKKSRSFFLWFLIPIILFSGVWHAYIGVKYGEVIWSNHAGFNLYRAWGPICCTDAVSKNILADYRKYSPKTSSDQWLNLNTLDHAQKSRYLQDEIIAWWWHNPTRFASLSINKLQVFISVRTDINGHNPQDSILIVFRALISFSFLFLFVSGLLLFLKLFDRKAGSFGKVFDDLNVILILFGIISSVVPALAESSAEEMRFIISVLPILAFFPLIIGKSAQGEVLT